MNKLKNYISLNLLSLMGIIFFIFCLVVFIILFPQARNYDIIHNNSEMISQYGLFNFAWKYFMYCIIIEYLLILLLIIELFIYKYFKNIKFKILNFNNQANVLYSIIFWIGLIFALFPICFIFYQYLEYLLTTHHVF